MDDFMTDFMLIFTHATNCKSEANCE